jgi:SAM-dependent methyltransferase
MDRKRHRIQFPQAGGHDLQQDEAFFYLLEAPHDKRKIRFHDYGTIYDIPGLYEQLFYDRLKCSSPVKVAEILKAAVAQSQEYFSELRILDLGAGNGLMGKALQAYGVSRLVGADIIPEAYRAMERDRPDVYDAYYIADFCDLSADEKEELDSWNFNCLTTVAALGFGDIPTPAFLQAFNLIQPDGWVAFNIKETFLTEQETSGFSRLVRELIFSQYLNLYHMERYRHRLSIEGEPLYYFAIAGRKTADIPDYLIQHYAETD